MKIAVCIKAVPETDTRIKIAADGRSIDRTGVKFIISPYDEFALEEAVRLKEAKGGQVIALSLGGDEVPNLLREALARGADEAMHITDAGVAVDDPLCVGKTLAAALKTITPDIVFFGKHGVGGDHQQVHTIVAEKLGWPQVTVVTKLEVSDGRLRAEREIEGGVEVIETMLPAVIAAQKGLNEPRYPKLQSIMQAKKKPLATKTFADFGLTPSDVGPEAAGLMIMALRLPPPRQAGRKITGDPDQQVSELLAAMQNEVKVI
ncbi:MAG: electron transfer flavoprotein subunit beta/FixA family protein [Chloracidobacterium sp.]|nr:electron transfer flavoprotein subunit beta/FixA family protein [Chloracidobacterium sp.]MDW8216935.1 electron transfer flavoprotein subunit beta/FixA family protein [Acidobacteriota bacterium]